jgi:hypothetical protein
MATTSLLQLTLNHPHTSKVDMESDIASGMRVSVLSRSIPIRQTSTGTTATSFCAKMVYHPLLALCGVLYKVLRICMLLL